MLACFVNQVTSAVPIHVIAVSDFSAWLSKQTSFTKTWLESTKFRVEPGCYCLIPDSSGHVATVLFCISDMKNFWSVGSLPLALPEGVYQFDFAAANKDQFAIAWGLGSYQFSRYKKPSKTPSKLVLLENSDLVNNIVESIYLVRDLINTPTDDMGPTELADAAVAMAKDFQADVKQIIGDKLLKENYASIHTVGRASDDAPRLFNLRWGNKNHPKVTLVGKGVCFDTGGLDLKRSSSMLLMKKDMGGAAHVLGLARMIMQAELPINLRVLIPIVENAVSGNAYRPGDIIKTRKGITVEIGNTDAEGRVILADALTEAVSEKPELLIDITTLTGSAREAVGTEISALFTNSDQLAADIFSHGELQQDPIWRLPLFARYRDALNTPFADINNSGSDPYAGAIIAGLFLKEFVPDDIPWMHFDMMAWNLKARPGKPVGGEAMALRALFSYLSSRFQGRS